MLEPRLMMAVDTPDIVVGRTLSAYSIADVQNNELKITYTVYNQEAEDVTGVLLTTTLQPGVTLADATQLPDQNGQELAWSLGTIPAYGRASVEVTVELANNTILTIDDGAEAFSTLNARASTDAAPPAVLKAGPLCRVLGLGTRLWRLGVDPAALVRGLGGLRLGPGLGGRGGRGRLLAGGTGRHLRGGGGVLGGTRHGVLPVVWGQGSEERWGSVTWGAGRARSASGPGSGRASRSLSTGTSRGAAAPALTIICVPEPRSDRASSVAGILSCRSAADMNACAGEVNERITGAPSRPAAVSGPPSGPRTTVISARASAAIASSTEPYPVAARWAAASTGSVGSGQPSTRAEGR
jgi:hypothetical protein